MSVQDWHVHAMSVEGLLAPDASEPASPAPAPAAVTSLAPVLPAPVMTTAPAPVVLAAPAPVAEVEDLAPSAPNAPSSSFRPRIVGRPAAVDADLRPVMVDKLAGDLADLTRVLLGVASSAVPTAPPAASAASVVPTTPTPAAQPLVALDAEPALLPEPPSTFAERQDGESLRPLTLEPIADVVPLIPRSTFPEEPPTPVAPTPSISVDVVLSELSFLDG